MKLFWAYFEHHSLTRTLTCSLACLLTYSFTYLLTYSAAKDLLSLTWSFSDLNLVQVLFPSFCNVPLGFHEFNCILMWSMGKWKFASLKLPTFASSHGLCSSTPIAQNMHFGLMQVIVQTQTWINRGLVAKIRTLPTMIYILGCTLINQQKQKCILVLGCHVERQLVYW